MQTSRRNILLLLTAAVLMASDRCSMLSGRPLPLKRVPTSIDVFQEMHYNQSQKSQEPPRFLPPEDSYPVGGAATSPLTRLRTSRSWRTPSRAIRLRCTAAPCSTSRTARPVMDSLGAATGT